MVGGFNPFLKTCSSNWESSPKVRGENSKRSLKPPASQQHEVSYLFQVCIYIYDIDLLVATSFVM